MIFQLKIGTLNSGFLISFDINHHNKLQRMISEEIVTPPVLKTEKKLMEKKKPTVLSVNKS